MQPPDLSRITVDQIELPLLKEKKINLYVLRLDKIHPVISGNKWFKLKYHLEEFKNGRYKGIISFGGTWSNHILAVAYAAKLNKVSSIGIIRGEEPAEFSQTLKECINLGMQLEFVSREFYKLKNDEQFLSGLKQKFPGFYIIPEGGAGQLGGKGATKILQQVNKNDYSHITCAIGTGTMMAGIANSLSVGQQLTGIPVLKGINDLKVQFTDTIYKDKLSCCSFFYDYHFGGYARHTRELLSFMNDFFKQTEVPTDFVYTGKLAYAVSELIQKDHFLLGSNILMIHSGGLQGNASLPEGTLIF